MLAALLYGQEDLRLEQVPDPIPGWGEVVIQVGAATTCGTDLKVWRRGGHARMLKPPTLFGHEAAGKIVAMGEGVSGWRVGDRVVANNSAPCMTCFFCQKQEYSLCTDLSFNNGTFAQYLKIPAPIVKHNLLPIPNDLPDALASLTEPLACVLHGIARSHVKSGDRVVVLGDGAIGLMFVAALRAMGRWREGAMERGGDGERGSRELGRQTELKPQAHKEHKVSHPTTPPPHHPTTPPPHHHPTPPQVLLFGGNPHRLQIGEQFGATKTFNYREVADVSGLVRQLTDGWGADVVIEATGMPSAWEMAIACARPGATVNLFGGCPRDTTITVNTEQLHYSELTLKGVFHNTPHYVRAALELLASRTVPFELLISAQRSLSDLEQAFRDMRDRKVIKVEILP